MKRLLLVVVSLFLIGAASATTITIEGGAFNTYEDLTITADSFPSGLSGYSGTLTVSNASVAEITSVTFPSWALIHNTPATPGSSVTVSGLDTGSSVQAGATGVTLATVRVHSIGNGTATLGISFTSMDDEVGTPVSPTVSNGTLTVYPIQGLHFSGPAAPTVAVGSSGQYYEEIQQSNLSWAYAIAPIVPEPLADMLGMGNREFGMGLVWFAVYGACVVIMWGRQKNVLVPMLCVWLSCSYFLLKFPPELRLVVYGVSVAAFGGVIFYLAVSKR